MDVIKTVVSPAGSKIRSFDLLGVRRYPGSRAGGVASEAWGTELRSGLVHTSPRRGSCIALLRTQSGPSRDLELLTLRLWGAKVHPYSRQASQVR